MNKVYGFEGEAKDKYGDMTYKLFADVFTASKFCVPVTNPAGLRLSSTSLPLSSLPSVQSIANSFFRNLLGRANTQSH